MDFQYSQLELMVFSAKGPQRREAFQVRSCWMKSSLHLWRKMTFKTDIQQN